MEERGKQLLCKARLFAAKVEEILKKEFGVRYWSLSKEDELRLLRLGQWVEKYRVSLKWILRELVPYWRERHARFRKTLGPGVTVGVLTGKVSEEIIQCRIRDQFPEGENVAMWKSAEKSRQWLFAADLPTGKEDWEFPRKTIREYQNRMVENRKDLQRFSSEQTRRRYRGNPWL